MSLDDIPILRRLIVPYEPVDDVSTFIQNALTQSEEGVEVSVAVLDHVQSHHFFGVPMAKRGIQPVWLRITNRSEATYRLNLLAIDPDYYSPLEAAAANRFSSGWRLLGFGFLA